MQKFKELIEAKKRIDELITSDDVSLFCDSLYMYTMYNDKDSIKDLLNIKNIQNLFTKPKAVYRVFRGSNENDYKINQYGITSTATKQDVMIDEFKDMIDQYKKNGSFFQNTIIQAEGIDINKLAGIFNGDYKRLKALYDTPGNEPVAALQDTFKQLKDQKEFLVFGNYKVKETRKV